MIKSKIKDFFIKCKDQIYEFEIYQEELDISKIIDEIKNMLNKQEIDSSLNDFDNKESNIRELYNFYDDLYIYKNDLKQLFNFNSNINIFSKNDIIFFINKRYVMINDDYPPLNDCEKKEKELIFSFLNNLE